jgi:hypothetical protein
LEKLLEMTRATICQVFQVSFRHSRTYYSHSYLPSIRVSFWRKIWLLMSWCSNANDKKQRLTQRALFVSYILF